METLKDWTKLAASWIAAVGGYLMQHLTLGKIALVTTVILTLMQCYKAWLDIKWRRGQLRSLE